VFEDNTQQPSVSGVSGDFQKATVSTSFRPSRSSLPRCSSGRDGMSRTCRLRLAVILHVDGDPFLLSLDPPRDLQRVDIDGIALHSLLEF
jgi:hypothetical protein